MIVLSARTVGMSAGVAVVAAPAEQALTSKLRSIRAINGFCFIGEFLRDSSSLMIRPSKKSPLVDGGVFTIRTDSMSV
jgi:hypothetical protein